MSYKKVLVAYDKSEQAKRALSAALELVDAGLSERVLVVSVYDAEAEQDPTFEIASLMAGGLINDAAGNKKPLISELEETIEAEFGEKRSCMELMALRGKPAEVIVNTANDMNCDLIVMGSRGLGAIQAVLGSVSTAVLRNCADLPVLITH